AENPTSQGGPVTGRRRLRGQPQGLIVGPGDGCATRRADEEPTAFYLGGREVGAPLERLRGSHMAGSALRARCSLLERTNHRLVGPDHGGGKMPSTPVGIVTVAADRSSKSAMRRPAFTRRRRPVHRRPYERMPEFEPRAMD